MIKLKKLICAASAAVLLGAGGLANAATTAVFTELALLMDVSGSVGTPEFNAQRNGYAAAFLNPVLHGYIAAAPGGVAVALVQWSGAGQQSQLGATVPNPTPWYHLTDAASSIAFGNLINGFGRAFSGQTAPGSAINFILPQFANNDFVGTRQVIDVSGDGAQNDGANTLAARNAALAAGVNQINGLPILGETGLLAWYQNNIQGGTGSFTIPAATFQDFEQAVLTKLTFEITGTTVIPVPAALPLLASGLIALGWLGRRRKA
jgi:X-X-X-Leu-X-X-Gly heptad repeat protein